MKLNEATAALFPGGASLERAGNVVFGQAAVAQTPVAILGTTDATFIGLEEILELGRRLIDIMDKTPGRPVIMLADNNGQRMALREELLALPQYIGHLVGLTALARHKGHALLAVLYGNAIAGGFIAWGLCADRVYALADANCSVMSLPAMARVTHIPQEKLTEMAKSLPVFAPGLEPFFRMGGIHEIWGADQAACLAKALAAHGTDDNRAGLGRQRNGRTMAQAVLEAVATAP
ncbi:MAG: biotin-independent malonate decarboxylase subunit gamma [Solidesulfovibrio sp. DCME]|uniref:biotin-independent malonate decarboxylase subunit gamma n=1 Tax=Solidesulfovibrio sp. DCME TaxID=3447380 RepID=UPI003D0A3B72